MKDTVILIVGIGALALGAYWIYNQKNSQLNVGKNGITGTLNIPQLAGVAGTLIGDIGGAISGIGSGGGNSLDPYANDNANYTTQ
jgi:hypothetical protein